MSAKRPVSLLLIEDNHSDAYLTLKHLSSVTGHSFQVAHSSNLRQGLAALMNERAIDAIVLDLNLPESQGLDTLRQVRAVASEVPIVVLSGMLDERVAMEALAAGAQDVIGKDEPVSQLLARSILFAVERHRAQQQQRYVERILSANPDAVIVADRDGCIQYVNPAAEELFDRGHDDFLGERLGFSVAPGATTEIEIFRSGVVRNAEMRVAELEWGHDRVYLASIRDVTEQKATATRIQRLMENASCGFFTLDEQGIMLEVNRKGQEIVGLPRGELVGTRYVELLRPDSREQASRALASLIAKGALDQTLEQTVVRPDGTTREVTVLLSVIDVLGPRTVLAVINDVTDSKHLQGQLLQAQKMEEIGRLAGGIAHDFNNLLTAIISFAGFAREGLPQEGQRWEDIGEVLGAAHRASDLTRQLLAFSRRQPIKPKVTDLNQLVSGLDRMLQRILGEDVVFITQLHPSPCPAFVDPGQFEQVIVNLTVNARDAMPTGGELLIETERGSESNPALGDHVLLRVTDTGVGMTPEVMERLFQPFFTTKETGAGTGLGLAMVYGLVAQAGGEISVRSKPGCGASFEIQLPIAHDAASPEHDAAPWTAELAGTETILVVEDELLVRKAASRILTKSGYDVREAASGPQAIQLFDPSVDLVLCDVVMPSMSGPDTADELRREKPGLKVLFMTGYTDDVVLRHGILDPGVELLAKPFSELELLTRVRHLLDS